MVYRAKDDQDEGDVHNGTRVCRSCGDRQAMTEFHWAASRKHRVRKCKSCCHKDQAERVAERRRLGATFGADRLRREYGLTPEDVAKMRAEQDDKCGLCRKPFGDRLHIDHCHETGHVRALLCHNCNLGLGHFYDDRDLILLAAEYLALHRERTMDIPAPTGRSLTPAERHERRRTAALRQHSSDAGKEALAKRSATFRGSSNHTARLTEDDVRAIRAAYAAGGTSLRELGEGYGVSPSHVGYIVRRKTWAHVE